MLFDILSLADPQPREDLATNLSTAEVITDAISEMEKVDKHEKPFQITGWCSLDRVVNDGSSECCE